MPPGESLDVFHTLKGLSDLAFNLFGKFGIIHHQLLCGLTTLCKLGVIVAEPRAALFDDVKLDSEVYNLSASGDSFAIDDIKLSLLERRGHLVLDDLDLDMVAEGLFTILDGRSPANVEPH